MERRAGCSTRRILVARGRCVSREVEMKVRGQLVCALAGVVVLGCGVLRAQTATTAAPLEDTYWKLAWAPGTKIEPAGPRQTPYIELNAASHRMSGSDGCNRLMGGYELEGDHLRFPGVARTMMACAHGMGAGEAMLKALDGARAWKVSGSTLTLQDANGHALARFAAASQ